MTTKPGILGRTILLLSFGISFLACDRDKDAVPVTAQTPAAVAHPDALPKLLSLIHI